jgi:hypothetical protein
VGPETPYEAAVVGSRAAIVLLPMRATFEILDSDQKSTSLAMSCEPQRIRADRCCNYILGMMGQGHTIYRNRTGHELPLVGATPLSPVDFRGLRFLELVGTADVRRLPHTSKDVRMSDREMEIQAWGVSL